MVYRVGTEADDIILGTDGDDQLYGFGGDDILEVTLGTDLLVGGAGRDAFEARGTGDYVAYDGNTANLFDGDTIQDFEAGDIISIYRRSNLDFTTPELAYLGDGIGQIDLFGEALLNVTGVTETSELVLFRDRYGFTDIFLVPDSGPLVVNIDRGNLANKYEYVQEKFIDWLQLTNEKMIELDPDNLVGNSGTLSLNAGRIDLVNNEQIAFSNLRSDNLKFTNNGDLLEYYYTDNFDKAVLIQSVDLPAPDEAVARSNFTNAVDGIVEAETAMSFSGAFAVSKILNLGEMAGTSVIDIDGTVTNLAIKNVGTMTSTSGPAIDFGSGALNAKLINKSTITSDGNVIIYDFTSSGETTGSLEVINLRGSVISTNGSEAFALSMPGVSGGDSAFKLDLLNKGLLEGNIQTANSGSVANGAADDVIHNIGQILGNVSFGVGDDFLNNEGVVRGTVSGGDGHDTLQGSYARDYLMGDDGDDVITGNGGNDGLSGGQGDDIIYSGNGDDNTVGGRNSDQLHGNAGDDFLSGESGSDSLFGGLGNDVLVGGTFADVLTGNGGADIFRFVSINDSLAAAGFMDEITDFSTGEDKIELSGLGAVEFIGTDAFSGQSGELQIAYVDGTTHVRLDANGDGLADLEIILSNGELGVTVDDFLIS